MRGDKRDITELVIYVENKLLPFSLSLLFFFSFLPLIVRGETIYRFDLFSDSFGMTEMEFAIVYVI